MCAEYVLKAEYVPSLHMSTSILLSTLLFVPPRGKDAQMEYPRFIGVRKPRWVEFWT